MAKKPDAAALLAALQGPNAEEDDAPPARVTPQLRAVPTAPTPQDEPGQGAEERLAEEPQAAPPAPKAAKTAFSSKAKTPRSKLKHIGGYLDDQTVEKVALLRIRLKLENSELLKLAIEDLYRKHNAKRAFGEA
jgi:hypothetical protein